MLPANFTAHMAVPALSFAQLRAEWIAAGESPKEANVAAAVAMAESHGHMRAHNAQDPFGGSWGPWQINGVHPFLPQNLTHDPYYSAIAAVYVRHVQGWAAWSTYRYGKYLVFMPHHHSARHAQHGRHVTKAHIAHRAHHHVHAAPNLAWSPESLAWTILGAASLVFTFNCIRKLKRLFARAVREEASILRRAARQRRYREEQALQKRRMPRVARRVALEVG